MFSKPKLLVSECLGFRACRYDASQVQAPIMDALSPFVEFIKVCPEVAIGLSIPRETLRLTENLDQPKLVLSKTGEDYTDKMNAFSNAFLDKMPKIHGAILKSRSPSCGIKDVKVYHGFGVSSSIGKGVGLFAQSVFNHYPNHPIEEEGRLTNFEIREDFFYKLFTLAEFDEKVHSAYELVQFHSKHKYALMSYQPLKMTELGQVVGAASKKTAGEDIKKYKHLLLELLKDTASIGRNINTLTHLYGYFKDDLKEVEKEHYFHMLELYKTKKIPLSAPISLLHSWALRFENNYLLQQSILNPFPTELRDLYNSGK